MYAPISGSVFLYMHVKLLYFIKHVITDFKDDLSSQLRLSKSKYKEMIK